jgi:hypothetical protein
VAARRALLPRAGRRVPGVQGGRHPGRRGHRDHARRQAEARPLQLQRAGSRRAAAVRARRRLPPEGGARPDADRAADRAAGVERQRLHAPAVPVRPCALHAGRVAQRRARAALRRERGVLQPAPRADAGAARAAVRGARRSGPGAGRARRGPGAADGRPARERDGHPGHAPALRIGGGRTGMAHTGGPARQRVAGTTHRGERRPRHPVVRDPGALGGRPGALRTGARDGARGYRGRRHLPRRVPQDPARVDLLPSGPDREGAGGLRPGIRGTSGCTGPPPRRPPQRPRCSWGRSSCAA